VGWALGREVGRDVGTVEGLLDVENVGLLLGLLLGF